MGNRDIAIIKQAFIDKGEKVHRERGTTLEILGFTWEFPPESFTDPIKTDDDRLEYNELRQMIEKQIPIVQEEFKRNHMSRRLMFQFDRDYYEDPTKLICIESFYFFFHNDNIYTLIINFRSSDINKLERDIGIIEQFAAEVFPDKRIDKIKVHCCSLHTYLNQHEV